MDINKLFEKIGKDVAREKKKQSQCFRMILNDLLLLSYQIKSSAMNQFKVLFSSLHSQRRITFHENSSVIIENLIYLINILILSSWLEMCCCFVTIYLLVFKQNLNHLKRKIARVHFESDRSSSNNIAKKIN